MISIRAAETGESAALLELWGHADAVPSVTDDAESVERLRAQGAKRIAANVVGDRDAAIAARTAAGYTRDPRTVRYTRNL